MPASTETVEQLKRTSKLKKAVTAEELQAEGVVLAPKFTANQHEEAHQASRCSYVHSELPTKDWGLGPPLRTGLLLPLLGPPHEWEPLMSDSQLPFMFPTAM